jgi:hypothetical protein
MDCTQQLSWPDAVVLVALIVFVGAMFIPVILRLMKD